MRTPSTTLTHANSDGNYSAVLNSAVAAGVRSAVAVVGPLTATVTPANTSAEHHVVSIDVPDNVPAGSISMVIDSWHLDGVLNANATKVNSSGLAQFAFILSQSAQKASQLLHAFTMTNVSTCFLASSARRAALCLSYVYITT